MLDSTESLEDHEHSPQQPQQTGPGATFSQFASRFLSQSIVSQSPSHQPLFYSTKENWELGLNKEDDILGDSNSSMSHHYAGPSRAGLDGASDQDDDSDSDARAEEDLEAERREYPGSRLWENGKSVLNSIRLGSTTGVGLSALGVGGVGIGGSAAGPSRGWRSHQSTLTTPGTVYQEELQEETDEEEEDDEGSPPSFLSPPSALPSIAVNHNSLHEPLLPHSETYIYPSARRLNPLGHAGKITYQDKNWLALYIIALCANIYFLVREMLDSKPPSSGTTTLLPLLSTLLFFSLLLSLVSLTYILSIRNALRHLITATLVGGPILLIGLGIGFWSESFSAGGKEWRGGLRGMGVLCWVLGALVARGGWNGRQGVERSVKVLELASQILLLSPSLLLLTLFISIVSTLLSLPFLYLLSTQSNLLSLKTIFILATYLWSIEILKSIRKTTTAGVVGSWYFERHEEWYKGGLEGTRDSLARATGPSLGTLIASSFLLTIFTTLAFVLERVKGALKSSSWPTLLSPLTYLLPIVNILLGAVQVFNGWVLCYVGLTGENFMASATKIRKLVTKNGTRGIGDNLLIKTLLSLLSLLWSLFASLLLYFFSSHLDATSSLLTFGVAMWTVGLCQGVLSDASDTLFVAFNLDLERKTDHCTKAAEAFGEPDSETLG